MKKLIYTSIFAFLLAGSSVLTAQENPKEYLGLPGDNLNLYAVMNLFQESETLESFEKKLNDSESVINNLDLNGDEFVDYIMVFDFQEANIHNIVLRVALNQNEKQDVAVFIVEKYSDGSVLIQLIGDEALYGPNYIIEPNYAETPNPGYQGPARQTNTTVVSTTYYEIAYWPVVEYIYEPYYIVWTSPWYWGCYTPFWSPWRPYYWHFYYGYHFHWHAHYYAHYRHWKHHRCDSYHHGYYTHIRNYSPTVVVNINNGNYSNTYNRPDRKIDGEELFAQKYPSGIKEPLGRVPKDAQNERQDLQKRPEAGRNDVKPENIIKPMVYKGNTRTSKDGGQVVKTPNDRNATDNNRGNRENWIQKNPESSKPVSSKPQVTEDRQTKEIVTSKPSRERTPEPERNVSRTSSSQDKPASQSSPPVSRNDNSSWSSSSKSQSSESSSRQSSSSSSTEGSRQNSNSGSNAQQSSSGNSNSSKSQDSQSNSSSKRK